MRILLDLIEWNKWLYFKWMFSFFHWRSWNLPADSLPIFQPRFWWLEDEETVNWQGTNQIAWFFFSRDLTISQSAIQQPLQPLLATPNTQTLHCHRRTTNHHSFINNEWGRNERRGPILFFYLVRICNFISSVKENVFPRRNKAEIEVEFHPGPFSWYWTKCLI